MVALKMVNHLFVWATPPVRDGRGNVRAGWRRTTPLTGSSTPCGPGVGFRAGIGTETQMRPGTRFPRSPLSTSHRGWLATIKSNRAGRTLELRERGPSNGLILVAFRAVTGRFSRLDGVTFSPRCGNAFDPSTGSAKSSSVLAGISCFLTASSMFRAAR